MPKVVDDVRGSRGVAVALRVKKESQVEVRAYPVVRVFDRCTSDMACSDQPFWLKRCLDYSLTGVGNSDLQNGTHYCPRSVAAKERSQKWFVDW